MPRLVGELAAAEKRVSSLAAFVPFLGPWLIARSESHTPAEKRTLTWVSIAISAFITFGILQVLPTANEQETAIHERIQSEIDRLGAFAEQYRTDHGVYPDTAKWRHYAEQADPRFYDPWGRPYRYSLGDDGFAITTLGRDGIEGGDGQDADASKHFPATSRAP